MAEVDQEMMKNKCVPFFGQSLSHRECARERIYTITQNNLSTALADINLSTDTETEIRNAVLAGNTATAHENQINFNGWIGEGYLLIDQETGAGAYKIAGGGNGGETPVQDALAALMLVLGTGVSSSASLAAVLKGAANFIIALSRLGLGLAGTGVLLDSITALNNCPVKIAAAPTIAFSIVMTVAMVYLLGLAIVFAPNFALVAAVAFSVLMSRAVNFLSQYSCNTLPE